MQIAGVFTNITIQGANITATSNYSGSVFGRIAVRTPCQTIDVTANDVHVKGANYTGGIMGNGKATNFTITNSEISGGTYVGGAVGVLENDGANTKNIISRNCLVTGRGSYIGGVTGQANELYAAFSFNNEVKGSGASAIYVGGITGIMYNSLRESAAINTNISVEESAAGGLVGYLTGNIYYSYSYGCTIEGNKDIGGIAGRFRYGQIGHTYNNNTVNAYVNGAGGIVGYLNNQDMTGANYTSRIYQSYVADTQITAPAQVGGIIGRIAEPLYSSKFYYSNYVDVSLICNSLSVSLGIGSDRSQNSMINKLYAYEGSKINGQIVTSDDDNILPENFLTMQDLKNQTTYSSKIGFNSSYFNYSRLNEGIYPLVRTSGGVIIPHQEGIRIPTAARTMNLMASSVSRKVLNEIETNIPETEIYAVDVNKINIEFESMPENVSMYYKIGRQEHTITVNKRVCTFKYDFKTPVEIEITDGITTKIINLKPEEVMNSVSIINGKTYYLKDNKIMCETNEHEGEFVNLYSIKALSKDGRIYNLSTNTWQDGITEGLTLDEETKSLETSNYNGIQIATFANFTALTLDDETTQKEGQILVRNGEISLIDSSIQKNQTGQIINNCNGKEYQSILGNDNKIYDLKTPLNYPSNFVNENIKSITTQSENLDETTLTVEYENGRIITFNYVTGKTIFDNGIKDEISLIDYIKDAFTKEAISEEFLENAQQEYKNSEELKEKLEETSIEKALDSIDSQKNNITESMTNNINNVNSESSENQIVNETPSKYITSYDSNTKSYVVYKEAEILDTKKEDYQSENSKISLNSELEKYYGAKKEEIKETNGLLWIMPTVAAIGVSLYVLLKRNRNKRNN